MSVGFGEFFYAVFQNPLFLITVFFTLGVIFVNGWTDAPNAIATCVSTRCISPRAAIIMAAICNFLGVLIMTLINSTVAQTVYNAVNFGNDSSSAMVALCAALLAIVLWATLAWAFGIPTSESHALIAGLSGAAIALQGSVSGINASEWIKVLIGLLLSTVLGFILGYIVAKATQTLCKRFDNRKLNSVFSGTQIAGGAAMAFMHGAQDGQKFMGVFLLVLALSRNNTFQSFYTIPIWLMLICSFTMAIGTAVGGKKIIKSVGMDMVHLQKYQGFSADFAAAGCLLLSSLTGIPVSTTHTKTTAIMGVGAAKRLKSVSFDIIKDMGLTWLLTFPGCGAIGYITAKIFLQLFI